MLFSTLVSQCYFKNGQNEKGRRYVSEEKKQKKNQKSVIVMISVVGTVFLVI